MKSNFKTWFRSKVLFGRIPREILGGILREIPGEFAGEITVGIFLEGSLEKIQQESLEELLEK